MLTKRVQDDISGHNLNDSLRENEKFAKAMYTDGHSQMIAMCMQPGDCVPKERHPRTTHFFSLKSGFLKIEHWQGGCDDPKVFELESGGCDMCVIPAGDYHQVTNPSEHHRAFLVTLYCGQVLHPPCFVRECGVKCEPECEPKEDKCDHCHKAREHCDCHHESKCHHCGKSREHCGCRH